MLDYAGLLMQHSWYIFKIWFSPTVSWSINVIIEVIDAWMILNLHYWNTNDTLTMQLMSTSN